MLICSCNVVTKQEIVAVIHEFLNDDPLTLITPSRIFHAMKKRGRCCGCFPNLVNIIVAEVENFHRKAETPESQIYPFLSAIKAEFNRCETARVLALSQKTKARNLRSKV